MSGEERKIWEQWTLPGKINDVCTLAETAFSWNRLSGDIFVHPASGPERHIGLSAQTESEARIASEAWAKENLIN